MTDLDDIIDAPLDKKSLAENPFRRSNKWDFRINLILLIITALSVFFGFIFEREVFYFTILGFIIMGIYQPISALVGAVRGNKTKLSYLIIAIAYVAFLFLGLRPLSKLIKANGFSDDVFLIFFVFVIPGFMAAYYTRLSYLSKVE